MQHLLTKIKQSPSTNKCALIAEAHARLTAAIAALETRATDEDKNLDFRAAELEVDAIEAVLDELESLLFDQKLEELKRIKTNLEKDHTESLKTLKFYELLNHDGKTYTADYAEFTGQKFEVPSFEEILSRLTPQNLKLYQKMEQDGLRPKLQITPIAFNIRTLGKKLDAKKDGQINTRGYYVSEGISDPDLQYSPTSIKASPDGQQIQITGGLTKSQWIKAHRGFLVDIVPMKPELDANPKIQKAEDDVTTNYNAVQAEKYAANLKENGLTPMSYESYLLAQMSAIKAGNALDAANLADRSLLLDSNYNANYMHSRLLAIGNFHDGFVDLSLGASDHQYFGLRLRASIRLS